MMKEPGWAVLVELAAAVSSGQHAYASIDAVTRRLAALYSVTIDIWTVPAPGSGLGHLAGRLGDPAAQALARHPALTQASATMATVTADDLGVAPFLAVPLPAHGRVRGLIVAQAHAGARTDVLASCQELLEALAPLLGLLLYTTAPDQLFQQEGEPDTPPQLYSRRYIHDTIDRELARARRTNASCAILLVSLDRVQSLNVADAPAIGDRVLRGLASALRATCRDYDTIERYSSDCFVALLPGSDGKGGRIVADRLLSRFYRTSSIADPEEAQHVRVSLGLACFPVDGFTADELLANAQSALAEAQRLGGNQVAAA